MVNLVFKYSVFEVFQLTALVVQVPNSPFCPFLISLGRVAIPAEVVTSTIACGQDFVREPHFIQRSFSSM